MNDSGIDTAVPKIGNFVEYLRELEDIFKKALTCVSGDLKKLLVKKTRVRKSLVRVPLEESSQLYNCYHTCLSKKSKNLSYRLQLKI
jgi:hypothetical protein